MKYYVLYNPKANNGKGLEGAKKVAEFYPDDELEYVDITSKEKKEIFEEIGDAPVILTGGDGTINRFANETESLNLKNDIYYFAVGSGNDFSRDLGLEAGSKSILLNEYLKNLPTVFVNGMEKKFINGIGYGIDGYCCEVADKIREEDPLKEINYAGIAIKGLLFHFKPTNATVVIDGKEFNYKKVWLCPSMNGKYYGGGMDIAPNQDRLNPDGTLSVVLMYGSGKIKTLMMFPNIFKGEHVKYKDHVAIHTGKEITVKFDRPCALQIDGETVLNVTEYTVKSGK